MNTPKYIRKFIFFSENPFTLSFTCSPYINITRHLICRYLLFHKNYPVDSLRGIKRNYFVKKRGDIYRQSHNLTISPLKNGGSIFNITFDLFLNLN